VLSCGDISIDYRNQIESVETPGDPNITWKITGPPILTVKNNAGLEGVFTKDEFGNCILDYTKPQEEVNALTPTFASVSLGNCAQTKFEANALIKLSI
jgi:hypothetical protein